MIGKIPKARGFDVSIKHIRAANSVALYGSFTAAAADLGMTQSAVSRLVLQLEKQLGVSLFLRDPPAMWFSLHPAANSLSRRAD